jgi:hypothetical protein
MREARRAARILEKLDLPHARSFAAVLRASAASHEGSREAALRWGEAALAGLKRNHIQAHATAVLRHLARARGETGPEFRPPFAVSDPDAMARMLAPELLVS